MKYIVITGGVLSGLGKGIVTASIGKLFAHKNIVPVKCDGYLNVDPGTMNPVEHGEVFVLDDGGEVDLDFGHYERFIGRPCKKEWNITSGKIFQALVEAERRGDFLGKTVQVIPHVTQAVRDRLKAIGENEQADVLLVEVGGTVGDIENLWFLEAAREMIRHEGKENMLFVHLGLVPEQNGEQKTKPMQQSLEILRRHGIFPDIVVGRSKQELTSKTKEKIQSQCNIPQEAVISDPDCLYTSELPITFKEEGLHTFIQEKLNLGTTHDITRHESLVQQLKNASQTVTIAVMGKYTELQDSYLSITEALTHAGAHLGANVIPQFIETTGNAQENIEALKQADALIVPGGFGSRGVEGKISAIKHARENNIPFLGICYGLQLAVVEYARTVCGLVGAHTTEITSETPHPVVDILPEQKNVTAKGATMRLGAYEAELQEGSLISALYQQHRGNGQQASERHRHRYEVNPAYHVSLTQQGLIFSGMSADKQLVEFLELKNHPYFVATQAHPELTSTLEKPSPLFYGLIEAALKQRT